MYCVVGPRGLSVGGEEGGRHRGVDFVAVADGRFGRFNLRGQGGGRISRLWVSGFSSPSCLSSGMTFQLSLPRKTVRVEVVETQNECQRVCCQRPAIAIRSVGNGGID